MSTQEKLANTIISEERSAKEHSPEKIPPVNVEQKQEMKVEKGKKKNKSGKGSKEINNDTKKSKGEIKMWLLAR